MEHSLIGASLVRSVQNKRVFTCQNLPEHGSDLAFLEEDRNAPPNDAFWYAKVRLPYAFLLLSEKRVGFEEINFHRIEIDCRTVNEASKKVIRKCGLTYEGTFRDFFWRKDHYEGRQVFSILRDEYEITFS